MVSVLFLLDLSYLLFLCVEWYSFIALVGGCVHVGVTVALSRQYVGYLGITPDVILLKV